MTAMMVDSFRFGGGPSYTLELPLLNPGGETGDTTGWTVVLGTSFRVETNGLSSTPEIQSSQRNPYAGTWCLAHTATTGINAPGIVNQDVALDGLSASRLADIDAGKVTARVEGFLLTDAGGTDRGCTELHFYSSGGVWLGGCLFDTMNRDNAWGAFANGPIEVPANTRTVRLQIRGITSGGDNRAHVYWDEFKVKLVSWGGSKRHETFLNLIGDNVTGWVNVARTLQVVTKTTSQSAWGFGSYLGWPSGAANAEATYTQNLPAGWKAAIDAAAVTLNLRYRHNDHSGSGGTGNSRGRMGLEFWSAVNAGGSQLGPTLYSDPANVQLPRFAAGNRLMQQAVPAGARSIRIRHIGERMDGITSSAFNHVKNLIWASLLRDQ